MSRTKTVKDGLTLSQKERQPDVFLARSSVKFEMLHEDVQWGLLPLGAVISVMPHLTGAILPAGSGAVKNGLMLCDGSVIPVGNTLIGNTPDINGDSYLRGASSSNSTVFSSNDRGLNVPQLPTHSHPLNNVAVDNMPHTHTATTGIVNAPHSHPASTGAVNAPHTHTQTITSANAPHSHNAPNTISTTPHSHPASTAAANMPHSHTVPASTGVTNNPHTHDQINGANSGTGWHRDYNNDGSASRLGSSSFFSAYASHPHTHSQSVPSSGGSHSHPATLSTNNMPHSHPIGPITPNNMPHSHSVSLSISTSTHQHTATIDAENMLHDHTQTLTNTSVPHSHTATVNPTGLTDNVNFEPQYVKSVFVMRVK